MPHMIIGSLVKDPKSDFPALPVLLDEIRRERHRIRDGRNSRKGAKAQIFFSLTHLYLSARTLY
jgi:hypothetical protein